MSQTVPLTIGLDILRMLVERKSTLSAAQIKAYRTRIRDIGDRCYFNAGWKAAASDKPLNGSASDVEIWKEIYSVTNAIQRHMKPARKAGRPQKNPLGDLLILAEFSAGGGKRTLLECTRMIFDTTKALDHKITVENHNKRVKRFLDKVKEEMNRTKNVLQFRPHKTARTKSDS